MAAMENQISNLVNDYRKARSLLRLGSYERWQVECITKLLQSHDQRILPANRLQTRAWARACEHTTL